MNNSKQTTGIVIAHHSTRGLVAKNLVQLVQLLSERSHKLIFVSTKILDQELEKLLPYATVIVRENFGYDFWSYKVGLDALGDLVSYKKIVFLNSSFISLKPDLLLEKALSPHMDSGLSGISLSAQDFPHIQSYWFSFDGNCLINSLEFQSWWDYLQPISERSLVVKHYEIGMSHWFSQRNISIRSLFEPSRENLLVALARLIASRRTKPEMFQDASMMVTFDLESAKTLNPTHFLWDTLVEEFGILKINLLIDNPTQQDLRNYLENLKIFNPNLYALVEDAIACH